MVGKWALRNLQSYKGLFLKLVFHKYYRIGLKYSNDISYLYQTFYADVLNKISLRTIRKKKQYLTLQHHKAFGVNIQNVVTVSQTVSIILVKSHLHGRSFIGFNALYTKRFIVLHAVRHRSKQKQETVACISKLDDSQYVDWIKKMSEIPNYEPLLNIYEHQTNLLAQNQQKLNELKKILQESKEEAIKSGQEYRAKSDRNHMEKLKFKEQFKSTLDTCVKNREYAKIITGAQEKIESEKSLFFNVFQEGIQGAEEVFQKYKNLDVAVQPETIKSKIEDYEYKKSLAKEELTKEAQTFDRIAKIKPLLPEYNIPQEKYLQIDNETKKLNKNIKQMDEKIKETRENLRKIYTMIDKMKE
ncbi:hypothetical protein ABEB36_012449 [Hypothenemus hampei]|uniref:Uncharacterized protein n=1 Tax=Hypothenemus hampei TaxID=57062 RepID=A0ABD1EB93_HYPHA